MRESEKRIRDGHQAREFLNSTLVTEVFEDIRRDLVAQVLAASDWRPWRRDAKRQALVGRIHALDAVVARLRVVESLGEQERLKATRRIA